MGTPSPRCSREAFFEWLNDCPTTWEIVTDDYGNTTVKFRYQEQADSEEGQ